MINKIILSFFAMFFMATTYAQTTSDTGWLEGGWGVTFPIYGGPRLSTEIIYSRK